MFSAIFKTLVLASLAAAVSAVALPSPRLTDGNDMCHCAEYATGRTELAPLVGAEAYTNEDPDAKFNCQYLLHGDTINCGYSHLGLLLSPFKHADNYYAYFCPTTVRHLLC